MKFFLFVIATLLSAHVYGQITIMDTEIKQPKYEAIVYDSLKNMTPEKYGDNYTFHHLIGQTLMYCGDPHSYTNRSNFKVGDYYRVCLLYTSPSPRDA